ncbi:MAG: glycosyltransferase [Alphaproteobacteria bacterium]
MQLNIELILTLLPFFIWIYLVLFYANRTLTFKGLFWKSNIIIENQSKLSYAKEKNSICFIIPARNEEKYISKTIESIISQSVKKLIVIVNDNSQDSTENEAKKTFKKTKFKQFKIINGKKLPVGWSGKVWALKQGVDAVPKKNFSHFVFIDSDIILKENIVIKALSFMNEKNLSMLSLMAKLKCNTIWEYLLIPSFIYFFQKLYPFSKVNTQDENIAAAAGGFILCKSELFRKKNLYELIKNKIIDDCNLAKIIKKKGMPIWIGLTKLVESQRSYDKLKGIWKMVSRTAYEQLNYSIFFLVISILGMFTIYLLPFLNLIIQSDYYFKIINLISINLMIISFIPTARFYNLGFVFYLSLPFSSFIYMLMTVSSAYNYYFKSGNIWKGRKY